jgi:glycosyltransferase involved in cell wall biosynthesis
LTLQQQIPISVFDFGAAEDVISVVIPFYEDSKISTHVAPFITAVLKPLLASYLVNEVLMIDDGSPDSVEIPSHDKIRLFRLPHRGLGNARNFGIEHSISRYVLILDSDIILTPELINCFLETIVKRKCAIACVDHVDPYVQTVWSTCESRYWRWNEERKDKNWLSCGCMLLDKDKLGSLRFVESGDEDTLFSKATLHLSRQTLRAVASHVFDWTLKTLAWKAYRGGERVARSQWNGLHHGLKSFLKSPFHGLRLAIHYKYGPLIFYTVWKAFWYWRGWSSWHLRTSWIWDLKKQVY